jgi:hypothetical protein
LDKTASNGSNPRLSLSEIKSEHSDGVIR